MVQSDGDGAESEAQQAHRPHQQVAPSRRRTGSQRAPGETESGPGRAWALRPYKLSMTLHPSFSHLLKLRPSKRPIESPNSRVRASARKTRAALTRRVRRCSSGWLRCAAWRCCDSAHALSTPNGSSCRGASTRLSQSPSSRVCRNSAARLPRPGGCCAGPCTIAGHRAAPSPWRRWHRAARPPWPPRRSAAPPPCPPGHRAAPPPAWRRCPRQLRWRLSQLSRITTLVCGSTTHVPRGVRSERLL